jgi:lysophospholipase L1-like esterase
MIVAGMTAFRHMFKKGMYTLAYILVIVVMVVAYLNMVMSAAARADSSGPDWAAPRSMALKRVADVSTVQKEPHFLENLDCSQVMFRRVGSSTMQTGCFTDTAFGMFDNNSGMVIFDGTDEGLPVLPYQMGQSLVPWPHAGDLIALTPDAVDGSYLSLYKGIMTRLKDNRNAIGQLVSKQLTTGADLSLRRPDGRLLLVNPQSLAFSAGGFWLVAETLQGSFVRINLATLSMTAFTKAYGSQGSPGLLAARIAVSSDGRFVAVYSQAANEFKVYDLATCGVQTIDLAPQGCAAFDYQPFIERQVAGARLIRHVRFSADGLLTFTLDAADNAKSGTYALAPTANIGFLSEYLGLGDSYTSGEGAFDYLAGTDTEANTCHLSQVSYPLLLARDLFGRAGGHSVACSGAVIRDIGDMGDRYGGQARDGRLSGQVLADFIPGYLAQGRFVAQSQPRVLTVSVGGNDIGFGDILATCVTPHLGNNTCFSTYEDRLELKNLVDRTRPRWTALYRQLATLSPATTIFAIGYPDVVSDTGSCGLNVHLNQTERTFARELVAYLDKTIAAAAADADVAYVDIESALKGHRLCEASAYQTAVNGLTAGTDFGVLGLELLGRESYHPNALGHSLIEQAILQATHNLKAKPVPATPGADARFLERPVTGRAVTNKSFQTMARPVMNPGEQISIHAGGLRPSAGYSVRLDGPGGRIITSVTANEDGKVEAKAALPDTTEPGGHSLDVTGPGPTDTPDDITQPVYVRAAPGDSDGDGLIDSQDSCPLLAGSGQDADRDGIDDTCDGLVGVPAQDSARTRQPNNTPTPGNSGDPKGGPGPHVPSQAAPEAVKPVSGTRPAGHLSPYVSGGTPRQKIIKIVVLAWLLLLLACYVFL